MRFLTMMGLCAVCACGWQPAQPDWKPSAAMDTSARMLKQLSRLEADLHDSDAQVDVYAELVRRHGQAQQVACQVTDEHVKEIQRLDLAQQRKRAEKAKKRRMARAATRSGMVHRALASR